MNQMQMANNSIKNDTLAALYGKYNYEEGLINQIYESESTIFTLQDSNSKALIFNATMQDSDSDIEEDQRSSSEFLADLNAEFHERVLLANQKRFYNTFGRVGSLKKSIDRALGGKGMRKEKISSKEVAFTKYDVSTSETSPETPSDFESEDSGCSRHMTGVKQYLHIYSKESGPKVVFEDNSSGDTKRYGSVNYNGITVNREKHIELVNIIGEPLRGITTRSRVRDSESASAHECLYVNFLSEIKPIRLSEAIKEEELMQEELNQFERNKGFRQEEWIDYDETFTPVVRLEAIRIFLAYAAYMGFMVYQMDVKSAFLNGKISEEVYVQKPPGFESSEFPNHVCKLDKALYGLK
nr:retrovirus-related Pol polyprotein from transposon TNT 1-94 [Tanacetum cinerariifolium]